MGWEGLRVRWVCVSEGTDAVRETTGRDVPQHNCSEVRRYMPTRRLSNDPGNARHRHARGRGDLPRHGGARSAPIARPVPRPLPVGKVACEGPKAGGGVP